MKLSLSPARRYARPLLALLLVGGAAVRIFAAWTQRHCPSADYGIVALMAKHMAEGVDFPVFFYGQSYMGSLEPAVSALFCLLCGTHAFAVCLGTAALAFFILPLVYTWGRDAGGRAAGLAGAALCVIGSPAYFDYFASPRGGYALSVALGGLMVWTACRIVVSERSGQKARVLWFALLGLAAGADWWTSPRAVTAILTAALVLLVAMRQKVFSWRCLLAAPAFALGSLPWWIWNIRGDWDSLSMGASVGSVQWLEGLAEAGQTFLRLLDVGGGTTLVWTVTVVVFCLFALFVAVERPIQNLRAGQFKDADVYLAAALAFFLVDFAVASQSHFIRCIEPRYLLSLWPPMGVILGVWIATLHRRLKYGLGLIPLAALLAWQLPVLKEAFAESKDFDRGWRQAGDLADAASRHGIDAIYGSFWKSWINFASDERVLLAGLEWERYAPYEVAAARAQRVAVLNDDMAFSAFLRATGGRAIEIAVGEFSLHYDLRPPAEERRVIDADRWLSATTETGGDVRLPLSDSDLSHGWLVAPARTAATHSIVIRLDGREEVGGVRLWSASGQYPFHCGIEVEPKDGAGWSRALGPIEDTSYFWSGPRFYYGGAFARSEFRFPASRVAAVRLTFPDTPARAGLEISELQLLGAGVQASDETAALPALLDLLSQRGIRFLYADRWVSERVYAKTDGAVGTHRDYLFSREVNQLPREKTPEYPLVVFSPTTALLTPAVDAEWCRRMLENAGIAMRETPVGPWVLFDFEKGWKPDYDLPSGLYWAGRSCFKGRSVGKQRAAALFERYLAARQKATPETRLAELDRVLKEYPAYMPAVADKVFVLHSMGREKESVALAAGTYGASVPPVPARVDFANGVILLGLAIDDADIRPGGSFTMKYFWQCPQKVKVDDLAVFVHWTGKDGRFQDDHVFLSDVSSEDIAFQPFPQVFVTTRTVRIPESAPPGLYSVGVGLVERVGGGRVRAKTDLPQKRRKVQLPVSIEVKS